MPDKLRSSSPLVFRTRPRAAVGATVGIALAVATVLACDTAPAPLPPPVASWHPGSADAPWPGPYRPEPPVSPDDVRPTDGGRLFDLVVGDSVGEPDVAGHATADITAVEFQASSTTVDGRGVALRLLLAGGTPDTSVAPADSWVAYGVVLDVDRDGRPDFRVGLDNALGERHREWVTEVATGETSINDGRVSYGHAAFGVWFDTYYRKGGHAMVIVGHEHGQPGVRLYAWASAIEGGAIASDYAPDVGWITVEPLIP